MTLGDLELTLANLRQAWRSDWPGLPKVVQACLDQLGFSTTGNNRRCQAIFHCLQYLSSLMEREGKALAQENKEPPYHNRLHTADALVALTTLLLRSRAVSGPSKPSATEFEWLGLLAMLGHDFRHPGQINRYAQEIEKASVAHLHPLMSASGLTAADQHHVAALILWTDPLKAPILHQKWRGHKNFDVRQLECMAILLEEADILASCLPQSGPDLSESLKQEWLRIHVAAAHSVATPAGRRGFLEAALFSSPASLALAIPTKVAEQAHASTQRVGRTPRL